MNNELNNEHSDSYVTPTFTDPTIPDETTPRHELLDSPERSHHRITLMGPSGWELRKKIFDTIGTISTLASTFINKIVSKFKKEKINEPGLLPSGNAQQLGDNQKVIMSVQDKVPHTRTQNLETGNIVVASQSHLIQHNNDKTSLENSGSQPHTQEELTVEQPSAKRLAPETIVTDNTPKPKPIENERE